MQNFGAMQSNHREEMHLVAVVLVNGICRNVVEKKGWKQYQKDRAQRMQAFSRVEMFCSNNGYNDFGNFIFLFPPF